MKLELECYGAPCSLSVFKINDIEADKEDFGEKYDASPETAPDYGCGDMRFFPKDSTPEVLNKYNITEREYQEICGKLDCLSFGYCEWCI